MKADSVAKQKSASEPAGPGKVARKAHRKVFQFKITLKGTKPPIWRRIQVPSRYSFWDLHCAIQDSMGWNDTHLHVFCIQVPGYVPVIPVGLPSDDDFGEEPTRPGWKLPIRHVFWEAGTKADYVYDFGDDWLHTVELEKILAEEEGAAYPRCLAGRRRCPPEECGGVSSFADMLEIIADPSHQEYDEWWAWLGDSYDPAGFSAGEVKFTDPKERLKMTLEDQCQP